MRIPDDVIVCRCEEVSAGEIRAAVRDGCSSLAAIRRYTRAGMGLCQGRTCTLLLYQILTEEVQGTREVEPPRVRPPVRMLSLERLKPLPTREEP